MQNAVNAVADAEFVLLRFEVNVRGALLVSFPDDLVDELDDARLLIVLCDFFVSREFEIERHLLAHLIEGFRADAIILLEGLFDLGFGRERELHGAMSVEAHGVEHGGIKRIAYCDLHRAIFHGGRQDVVLEGDLGGNLETRLVFRSEFGEVEIRPVQSSSEALEKSILRQTEFAGEKGEKRILRSIFHGDAPSLLHLLILVGHHSEDGGK